MESVRRNLQATPHIDVRWRQEIEGLNRSLENYNGILTQLYEPAVNLKAQKKALQQIGLAFSREVEEEIEAAVEAAMAAPEPKPEDALEDLFTE